MGGEGKGEVGREREERVVFRQIKIEDFTPGRLVLVVT